MGPWLSMLLPFLLVLSRVSAFLMVLPIFGWQSLPMRVRAGAAVVLSIFFAYHLPPPSLPADPHWLAAALLVVQELLTGLSLGLAVRLLFQAIEQGGRFASRQMGFAMAQVVDPNSGDQSQPVGMVFEYTFALFFLAAGGHQLLILLIARSYDAFPVAQAPEIGAMCEALIQAGSLMLTFMLRLAAPLLAASVVLTVVLGVLAKAVPEMNILLMSFPLRIGAGFLVASAIMPHMGNLTYELAQWMSQLT